MVAWTPKTAEIEAEADLLDKLASLAVEALDKPRQMARLLDKRILEHALELFDWNQVKTADFLGCHRNTLARRIREYGIRREPVMSSRWNHSICDDCWTKRSPEFEPHRMIDADDADKEFCCFCSKLHGSGIFIRLSPYSPELQCHGDHSN